VYNEWWSYPSEHRHSQIISSYSSIHRATLSSPIRTIEFCSVLDPINSPIKLRLQLARSIPLNRPLISISKILIFRRRHLRNSWLCPLRKKEQFSRAKRKGNNKVKVRLNIKMSYLNLFRVCIRWSSNIYSRRMELIPMGK